MSTAATAIRDAAFALLQTLPGYVTCRKVAIRQLQPEETPALTIVILNEVLTPDGDANAGNPHFESSITIGISVLRGFDDPVHLDGLLDADVDGIETKLLTNTGFMRPDLIEACTGITRRRLYPQQGDAYYAEVRLELTFMTRVDYLTPVPNVFVQVAVETTLSDNPDTELLYTYLQANQQ